MATLAILGQLTRLAADCLCALGNVFCNIIPR
jgi:hypothetical protein